MSATRPLPDPPRAWIFDMDATLTVGKHDFEALRRDLNLPPGSAILESIESLPEPRRSELHERLARWEWDIAAQTEPALGARSLLEWIRERGWPTAVLTRNRRDIALHTLHAANLMEFFEPPFVLGRDCAPAKPAPDGIFSVMARWGGRPSSVAMVGDYLFDLQAGRAADCFTVHVGSPMPQWGPWTDLHVPDLPALLEHFASTGPAES